MKLERGMVGTLPYAATGTGRPVLLSAGLWNTTGVTSNAFVRESLSPARGLMAQRRITVLNRRAHLPRATTLESLAAEYAWFIRDHFGFAVDVIGVSTGGSIAQQLAADHPDTVRRLVLLSSACRLGPGGRKAQADVAADLRAGRTRNAAGGILAGVTPRGLKTAARAVGWIGAGRILRDSVAVADLAATIEAEDDFDLSRHPHHIAAKTLIVGGARDRFYNRELFHETADLIPDSHIHILKNRGHITVTNDPRARSAIAGFLSAPDDDPAYAAPPERRRVLTRCAR